MVVKDRNICFYFIVIVIKFQEEHKIFTKDLREIHVFLTNSIYNEENMTAIDIQETQRKDFQV